jgi:hypothetical protein
MQMSNVSFSTIVSTVMDVQRDNAGVGTGTDYSGQHQQRDQKGSDLDLA